VRASAKITAAESLGRLEAARDYGLKLTRANGKSGAIGFSTGGTMSLRFAAQVPMLHAVVVFYGATPAADVLAKISAPILQLYGDLDAGLRGTEQATAETMKKLSKTYEMQVYPHATNFFLIYQDMAQNGAATNMAWPKAMGFLKEHMQ